MNSLLPVELKEVERKLRVLVILDSAEAVGLDPLPAVPLHTIAYFTDVLAPVWNLPVVDGQMLKRDRPYYPSLQDDIDRLVGQGVVLVNDLQYVRMSRGGWRAEGNYKLHHQFADRILDVAKGWSSRANEISFIREVVFATSGLGLEGIGNASAADATYSDPLVDLGGMIELERGREQNPSARVALRFGTLLDQAPTLTNAEMINLYVRQLYARMQVA